MHILKLLLTTLVHQIPDRLTKVKEETISSVTGQPINFRFGISHSPIPEPTVTNQDFFKELITSADINLNDKRKTESKPNLR